MNISKSTRRWSFALIFFVYGDLITTFYAMEINGIVEMNSLFTEYFVNGVYDYFIGAKLFTFLAIITFWWFMGYLNFKGRSAIPLTLGVFGLTVTLWNCAIIGYVML